VLTPAVAAAAVAVMPAEAFERTDRLKTTFKRLGLLKQGRYNVKKLTILEGVTCVVLKVTQLGKEVGLLGQYAARSGVH
jgi:hypothetical protein